MKVLTNRQFPALRLLAAMLLALPLAAAAQVPVDDNGRPYDEYSAPGSGETLGDEDIPLRSAAELEELVGPIALYPDDLLAIVLPASTYPLQVVQAGRFIEALEEDPSLEPDENWDDSVVALTNYPEVVELMNDDLDWTWRLGEAVIAQQQDVIAAVESFRDRAYAAGNLESDAHQRVAHSDEGIIEIVPMEDDVIYVPYYEPAEVVVYQPRRVYYYYPRPYPVYYYPYPSHYDFDHGYFWGVTTAFTIGWYTDRLHVFHHSYHGHPYYGHHYWDRWWYRRPSLTVYNTTYVHNHVHRSREYHRSGDYWESRQHRRLRQGDGRITRNRVYPGDGGHVDRRASSRQTDAVSRFDARDRRQASDRRDAPGRLGATRNEGGRDGDREIRFRERPAATRGAADRDIRVRERPAASRGNADREIRFRERTAASRGDADREVRSRERKTAVRREADHEIRFRERPQTSRRDGDRVRRTLTDTKHHSASRSQGARTDRRAPETTRVASTRVEQSRPRTVRAPSRSRSVQPDRQPRAEHSSRSHQAAVQKPQSREKLRRPSRSRPESSGSPRRAASRAKTDERKRQERRARTRDRD